MGVQWIDVSLQENTLRSGCRRETVHALLHWVALVQMDARFRGPFGIRELFIRVDIELCQEWER
jgi:hypothetical protein